MHYFIVAGETSGDHLGGKLIHALKASDPEARFSGVGGNTMIAAGLKSLFPLQDIAVMGIGPVLANLPRLLGRIAQTAEAVRQVQPDALILIDSPDFTHRVARKVRHFAPCLPIIDYVSPTVWAWRPGRAKVMRRSIDLVLALLPFEPDAHRRLGGPDCVYVGHPLIERLDAFRADQEPNDAQEIVILPGSRRSVIRRMGGIFGEAVAALAQMDQNWRFVLPVAPNCDAAVAEMLDDWSVKPQLIHGEAEKFAAFTRARAALAVSGTTTLELALAGTPTIVAYKVPKFEEVIGRRLIQVPTIVLPNLILGANIYPEYLQQDATGQALAGAMRGIIEDGPARQAQIEGLKRLPDMMLLPEGEGPSHRAARAILDKIADKKDTMTASQKVLPAELGP